MARSVIQPTSTLAATLEAGITAGIRSFRLLPGTYTMGRAMTVSADGVTIEGAGSLLTTIEDGYAPATDQADVNTNALFLVRGSVSSATINTTLSVAAARDTRTITVVSATGISAGQWLRIQGHNTAYTNDENGMSDGTDIVLTEIVQVASVASNVLTLTKGLDQFHCSAATVIACTPRRNFSISGVKLDCSSGTIACGFFGDYVDGFNSYDVSAVGFSRAVFNFELGSRRLRCHKTLSLGENNAIWYLVSCQDFKFGEFDCVSDGLRQHTYGIPRGLFTMRSRCTDGMLHDGKLRHANVGIRTWGGKNVIFDNIQIVDMDPTEVSRDSEVPGGVCGAGVDQGAGPLNIAEFAMHLKFNNVHIHSCFSPTSDASAPGTPGWYYHDTLYQNCGNISIVNDGNAPQVVVNGITYSSYGLFLSDTWGAIDHVVVKGVLRAIVCNNVYQQTDINYAHLNGGGAASNTIVALAFRSGGGLNSSPRIRRVKIESYNNFFYWESGYVPDYEFRIEELDSDGQRYHDLVLAINDIGSGCARGDVVELDATSASGTRHIKTASGPNQRCAVVASGIVDTNYTYQMVAPCPSRWVKVMAATGAVAVGDLLEVDASRRAVVNNSPSNILFCIGRALGTKAAGSAGLVAMGPR